ncbi:pyridoxamine 5'-phosphate oxidase family protein [Streptomyces sp. enrichment culture]|uniref:pyridoxamine 5'-phosphate oxidase family protein n=1 Tax=Streptomyces sp. enrichment culture TaxID=1795815 RepID=UPI003F57EF8A
MSNPESLGPTEPRLQDVLRRLEEAVDAWVATAGEEPGAPYLVPLPSVWDGTSLLIATPAGSRTGRDLAANGRARVGIGGPRDVVLVEGVADAVLPADLPQDEADAFAARTGVDPRELSTPYLYFRIRPVQIQAWRETGEGGGRELMAGGTWLVTD